MGGLAVTLILIGTVCGFMLVDLSSDRYMPGEFAPLYLIDAVDAQGLSFHWMGEAYRVDPRSVMEIQARLWPWRGLLPRAVRLAAGLVL